MSAKPELSPLQPFTVEQRLVGARLCHFPTGSEELLNGHKDWIDRHFIPKMRQHPNAWIDLIGEASLAGGVMENLQLSSRRILAVEQYIRKSYPEIRVNLRLPKGASEAGSFNLQKSNNDGYWRAVLIRWYGVPLAEIPTPVYPPEEPKQFKKRVYKAPKGCWCIIGVDSVGVPIKAAVSGGTCEITLLNDKGEKWAFRGAGAGLGIGAEAGPEHFKAASKPVMEFLKAVGAKAGDISNVHTSIKDLNLTGPNETSGGVMKRMTWAANLTFPEIISQGIFAVYSGEGHFVMGGAEMGFIFFGMPPIEPISIGKCMAGFTPWGFFASAGLGTLKGALGASMTLYKITKHQRVD